MEIELKNISYEYRLADRIQPALQDVSLRIQSQEFVAIVGPSGCGKSTLLNLVGGFLAPSRGSVLVGGKKVHGPGADRILIFQKSSLFPFYSAAQNIEFGLKLRGVPEKLRQIESRRVLEAINLSDFANAYPKELSEGMKKLVEVARALVLSTPVILFDESLGSVDALKRYRMQQLIQDIYLHNRPTVLWVTHDLEEAVLLADRVVVMSHRPGRIDSVKDVALPRPRTEAMRTSSELQAIRREIFDCLVSEGALSEVVQ